MLFKASEVISLGQDNYQIVRFLGCGAVADVYLAKWLGHENVDLIIKVLRDDYKKIPFQEDREKLFQAMQAEVDALTRLNLSEDSNWGKLLLVADKISKARKTQNKRKIIALFDKGVINEFPYLIQELAPAEFKPFEVNDLQSERKMLQVALGIAQAIQIAHSNKIALKDFEPYTKGDRIRLHWHDSNGFEIKIIDWNINGIDDSDFKTDLVYLGCHFYRFFVGEYLPFDNSSHLPPEKLDLYPAWNANLNEGSRLILQRLLSRIPIERYSSIDELVNDLSTWLDDLKQYSKHSQSAEYIAKQCETAFNSKQYRRVLALAHLALDNIENLSNPEREGFNTQISAAREKIEENYWPIIDKARLAYSMQKYDRSAQEYALKIKELPPQILLTKEACAEMLLAQAKDELSNRTPSQLTPTLDKKLDDAVQLLLGSKWDELTNITSELPDIRPIRLLSQWADFEIALLLVKNSALPTPRTTEKIQEWLFYEEEYITNFSNALEKARAVANGLSFLPWIAGELDTLQLIYEQSKDTKDKISNLGHETQALQPSFSVLMRVDQLPEGRKSLEDGLNELIALEKRFISEQLAERITELLHKSSQFIGYKGLGDQPWLLELSNDFLNQQEYLGCIKEKIEQYREASNRENEIIDLLKKHEYAQAGQRFEEFEKEYKEFLSYPDVVSMAQQVNDGIQHVAENWQKLKNAANFLQPFNNTFRNFEAAQEELGLVDSQIPEQMQHVKDLLQEFVLIALDYPLINEEPTFDNIAKCFDVSNKLYNSIKKMVGEWQILILPWADSVLWDLTDIEKEWTKKVNVLRQEYKEYIKREIMWRNVFADVKDGKAIPWNKNSRNYKHFAGWPPILEELYNTILVLKSETEKQISEEFYIEYFEKFSVIFIATFYRIMFDINQISDIDNIIAKIKELENTKSFQKFNDEWSFFANSEIKALLDNLYSHKITYDDLLNNNDKEAEELINFISSKWHNLYKNFLIDDAIKFRAYLGSKEFLDKNVESIVVIASQIEKWNEYFTLLGLAPIELEFLTEYRQQKKCKEETEKISVGVKKIKSDISDRAKTNASLNNEVKQLLQGISTECHSFINQTDSTLYNELVFIETYLQMLKEWDDDLDNKPASLHIDDELFLIDNLNKNFLEIKNLQEQGNLDCIPDLADRYNAIGQKLLDRIDQHIQVVSNYIKPRILLTDTSVDLLKRIFSLSIPDNLTEKSHSKLIELAKDLRFCLIDDLQRNSLSNMDLKSSQSSLSKLAQINDFLNEDNISTYDILDIVKRTDSRFESRIDERTPPTSNLLHSDDILLQEYLNEYQRFCENELNTQSEIQILLGENKQYQLKLQKVAQLAKTARNYLTSEFSQSSYRVLYILLDIAEVMSDKEESLSQLRYSDVFSEFLDNWEMEVLRLADIPSLANAQSLVIDCWKKNPNLFSTLQQVRQFRQYYLERKLVMKNPDWKRFDQLLTNWPSWLLRGWLQYHWMYLMAVISLILFVVQVYILIDWAYPKLSCVYNTIAATPWKELDLKNLLESLLACVNIK